MHTVVMPKLSDTMEEGKILSWLKQEGDPVAKGDALAEIETEKVNIEVEAFKPGVLRKILVPIGATVPVGAPIALTGAPDEPLPADVASLAGAASTAASAATAQADSPTAPSHAQSQASAAAAINAAPVSQPASAGAPGTNGYVAPATSTLSASLPPAVPRDRVFISPIARRLASEHNLDITQI